MEIMPGTKPSIKKSRIARRHNDNLSGLLYTSPFFVLFALFGLYPAIFTIYVSLHKWSLLGDKEFVGFRNYRLLLLHDPLFWKSIRNTFIIWFESVPLQLVLATIMAVLLNQAFLKWKGVFRFLIFLPNITSLVAVSLIFANVFGVKYGLINYLLESIGLSRIDWVVTPWATQFAVSLLIIWRYLGFHMIIQLAGLQSIPNDLYESATIDGASRTQQFVRITIPMLMPTLLFSLIIATTGGLQIFTEPYAFMSSLVGTNIAVNGGSSNQVLTVVMYLYKTAFTDRSFGYSSAIANLLLILIILFSLFNTFVVRKLRD
ncbi:cytochrome c biogenesis protein [Paenibacillus sp. CCS19]|uniref:carbohydrate ABC transporter permease n=1 Tax=Paenibacillus sp. CCS19 TaxID=3158387 RepID=UPI00256E104D|nr:sugar ABC transporter permease [Paenibacillus cellulosilyticus]GMK41878.1 cytochrome c biogenesis protein [Paenibacillus cellulosilyticus]